MRNIITTVLSLICLQLSAQEQLPKEAKRNVVVGKMLYRSEMASWYGTDLFMERYTDKDNIGGYFSYSVGDSTHCIFFSRTDHPTVIGTISFDTTYNTRHAVIDLKERPFTGPEIDLYTIRTLALNAINQDTLFKKYKKTNLNLIPVINSEERVVFVLTGPQENGVVIFGNDYLLTFDKGNQLVSKKSLHKNIISIAYESGKTEATIHTHLPETGDYITPTDVCTLMLYQKFAGWTQHNIVSTKYLNIWNCATNELSVMPMSAVDKILGDQERRKK